MSLDVLHYRSVLQSLYAPSVLVHRANPDSPTARFEADDYILAKSTKLNRVLQTGFTGVLSGVVLLCPTVYADDTPARTLYIFDRFRGVKGVTAEPISRLLPTVENVTANKQFVVMSDFGLEMLTHPTLETLHVGWESYEGGTVVPLGRMITKDHIAVDQFGEVDDSIDLTHGQLAFATDGSFTVTDFESRYGTTLLTASFRL